MFSITVVDELSRKLKCLFRHQWENRCHGMKRCTRCGKSRSRSWFCGWFTR